MPIDCKSDSWNSESNKILFESNSYKDCDFVISIIAPIDVRIDRVIKRDNLSYEEVLIRIKNQWTDKQRIINSDFVINNDMLENSLKESDFVFSQLNHKIL